MSVRKKGGYFLQGFILIVLLTLISITLIGCTLFSPPVKQLSEEIEKPVIPEEEIIIIPDMQRAPSNENAHPQQVLEQNEEGDQLIVPDVPSAPPEEEWPDIVFYNGFEFRKNKNYWNTIVTVRDQPFNLTFHFNPFQVEDILVEGKLDDSFNQPEIFVTFDPFGSDLRHVAEAAGDLSLKLIHLSTAVPHAACTVQDNNACINRPIKTCDSGDAVIFIQEAPTPKLLLRDNCLIIQGEGSGLLRVVDRILFDWYGIWKKGVV